MLSTSQYALAEGGPKLSALGERVVDIKEMMLRRSIKSRQTIYNHVQAGVLPPLRSFGPRRKGWLASEVQRLFENGHAASN